MGNGKLRSELERDWNARLRSEFESENAGLRNWICKTRQAVWLWPAADAMDGDEPAWTQRNKKKLWSPERQFFFKICLAAKNGGAVERDIFVIKNLITMHAHFR